MEQGEVKSWNGDDVPGGAGQECWAVLDKNGELIDEGKTA